jgi:capsular polysaccharide biosynthesis protein
MTYVQSAAANLKDASETIGRHRWLVAVVFIALMLSALLLIDKIPRSYGASANVLVVNGNSRNDPTLSSPDLPSIATSTVVLERVRQHLGLTVPLQVMKHQITAKSPPFKSSIMRIEYSDPSAALAATVANGVADELAHYYNQLSTIRYDNDLSALDGELAKQKTKIESIDARLKASGAVQTSSSNPDDKETGALVDQLNALETQRALANATLQGDSAAAQAIALDAQTRSDISRREILQNDPSYQSLAAGAAKETASLADVRAQYTERYPGLPALQAKVDSLNASVAQEANRALAEPHAFSPALLAALADQRKSEALVAADRARVSALDDEVTRQRQQLAEPVSLELLRLERDGAVAEYRTIAARRATSLADRADALSLGSVVVVDRALASQAQLAIGTRRLIGLIGLLSLILALGSAFLADQLNPRLRRAAQIESLYGLPVIATIGKNR